MSNEFITEDQVADANKLICTFNDQERKLREEQRKKNADKLENTFWKKKHINAADKNPVFIMRAISRWNDDIKFEIIEYYHENFYKLDISNFTNINTDGMIEIDKKEYDLEFKRFMQKIGIEV